MEHLTVGQIVNTHGVRGDVKVWPRTDFPEQRFSPGAKLWVQRAEEWIALVVKQARAHKNVYIVHFENYDDINQVESFKGEYLKVPVTETAELSDDEFYYYEIIGCEVESTDGSVIGTVTEILQPGGANDVWVVTTPDDKQVLLPYIDEVILQVDVAGKRILVELMEGML